MKLPENLKERIESLNESDAFVIGLGLGIVIGMTSLIIPILNHYLPI